MSRHSLGKSVFYNFAGVIVQLLATAVTVPFYLHAIGEARFGIMSQIWLLFGYFGLFDFGLSRATANRLARLRGGDQRERSAVFHTAIAMNMLLGLFAGAVFYVAAVPLLTYLSGGTTELATEIPKALPWIAAFFPLAMVGGVFIGSLEAEEQFFTINLQQIVGTILIQCLPLAAVLLFGAQIEVAVIGAIAARFLSVAWSAVTAIRMIPSHGRPEVRLELGRSLLKYGGWVTVTNSISPLLVSSDQFLIAFTLGAGAVAYYSVPFNLAMKALIVPGALTRALFPRLSSLQGPAAAELADRASGALAGVMALICAPAIVLSNIGLTLWVGPEFASAATPVAEALLVGAWFNGVAFVPFALLQGQGKPDVVAKIHALELIPFVSLLWVFLQLFGLQGAALAWVARVSLDTALLYWATGDVTRRMRPLMVPASIVVFTYGCTVALHPTPAAAVISAFAILACTTLYVARVNLALRDKLSRALHSISQ